MEAVLEAKFHNKLWCLRKRRRRSKRILFVFIIVTSKFVDNEYSVHIPHIMHTFFDRLVLWISDTTTTQILYKNAGYKHKKFRLLGTKMRKWPIPVTKDRLWKFWKTMQICWLFWRGMSSTSESICLPTGLKELCYAALTLQQFRASELLELIHSHLLPKSHLHSLLTCSKHSTPVRYLSVTNPSINHQCYILYKEGQSFTWTATGYWWGHDVMLHSSCWLPIMSWQKPHNHKVTKHRFWKGFS
jgi:hypothetical protein